MTNMINTKGKSDYRNPIWADIDNRQVRMQDTGIHNMGNISYDILLSQDHVCLKSVSRHFKETFFLLHKFQGALSSISSQIKVNTFSASWLSYMISVGGNALLL